MKIGIITYHNHYNYGAVLQAYALNRTIQNLGYECQTIDCEIDPGKGRLDTPVKWLGASVTRAYNLLNFRSNRRHVHRFKSFIKNFIPISPISYHSLEALTKDPPVCDVYITGSDQVWRPILLDNDLGHAFHLGFISSSTSKLISYAPSFGVSTIPDKYRKVLKKYIMRYDFLSVRERKGKELIGELTGRESELVLDPTLLLNVDDYKINNSPYNGEYILVYPMELGLNMDFYNLVKTVKKILRLPVVMIFPLNYDFRWLTISDKVFLDAGPIEFISLIKNASFVCTNSFHGTAFSIKYEKRFCGSPHSISNSRIENLLSLIGLQERQIHNPLIQKVKDIIYSPIDYHAVNKSLDLEINLSIRFLKKALSNGRSNREYKND